MPSVIGTDSGSGINVAANYLRAKPSTRFSTRQLAFVEIEVTGCQNNYADSNSLYSRAIRGVQTVAEVYAVGVPDSNKFMVVIAQDTDGADDNNFLDIGSDNSISLQTAVSASVNDEVTVNATYKHMFGNGFTSGVMTYSDESVSGNDA